MRFYVELVTELGGWAEYSSSFACEKPLFDRPGFDELVIELEDKYGIALDCEGDDDSDGLSITDISPADPEVAKAVLTAIRDRFEPTAEITANFE